MDLLNRHQAPFGSDVWERIDAAAVKAARDRLTVRRVLDAEGPYGAGLTTIEVGNDDFCRQPGPNEAGAVMGRAISVPMLRKAFRLSVRRVAAFLDNGMPLDLAPVDDAAEAVATREEELFYYGQPDFHLEGLLTAEGRTRHQAGDWSDLDQVLNDVLASVTKLDEAGVTGSYALVLAPALYNGLFRRYPESDLLQLDHLRRLCSEGIYKAPITGGALISPLAGVLVVGQDLMAGYIGQDGVHYDLYLAESIVLRLDQPQAICSIEFKA
jgi:Uncharacterized protein, linocin/CFP29 homolog